MAEARILNGHLTRDVNEAAAMLKEGKLIAIPTDSVYALAASVDFPDSVDRIFRVKDRDPDKNISLLLPDIETLVNAGPDFSDLLWTFLKQSCPCPNGFVVPKGDWLEKVCPKTQDLIGNEDSICIRISNCSELSLLALKSGPLALSSANLSGKPDSTHHSMVQTAFGNKIDGILCIGDSLESKSSSVVNCLHFDRDEISYFRIGCTPQEVIFRDYKNAKKVLATLHIINPSSRDRKP
ncbi:threonylcarbamoyl-AMP synthase-like [Physella acuta]|uniref:threonylcarbamoyl-AMP synthase-like n=1 Tax=Physella acuta TaxID=109671 RepID=UPI0027DBFDE7|nr:threonylcarbamoyl-AMP synthase-like [Physella acuta]